MEWLWGLLLKVIGIGGKGAKDAIIGYDRLTVRLEKRLDAAEQRLDECDEDRHELRTEIAVLTERVETCDEHRKELANRLETLEQKTQ